MISEEAVFYKKDDLKDFEKKVNEAAIQIALKDTSLLKKRGELLAKARKKVASDGYVFKKGASRSKDYGVQTPTPKRPRYAQDMRDERIKAIDDELADINKMMTFKEKRLSQAEAAKNYKLCEQVTEELMQLKTQKRELATEKRSFEMKDKRSARRKKLKSSSSTPSDNDSTTTSESSMTPLVPLPPECSGSRINPISCDSPGANSSQSPLSVDSPSDSSLN